VSFGQLTTWGEGRLTSKAVVREITLLASQPQSGGLRLIIKAYQGDVVYYANCGIYLAQLASLYERKGFSCFWRAIRFFDGFNVFNAGFSIEFHKGLTF